MPLANCVTHDRAEYKTTRRQKNDGPRSIDSPHRALHVHAYRHALEQLHQDLLPAFAGKRKTEKSGPDRSHEKAVNGPPCVGQVESTASNTRVMPKKIQQLWDANPCARLVATNQKTERNSKFVLNQLLTNLTTVAYELCIATKAFFAQNEQLLELTYLRRISCAPINNHSSKVSGNV